MNIFDIITIIVLLLGVFFGWRSGLISQLGSLAGVIIGVALAIAWGESVGAMLNLDPAYSKIVGFIITFIVALIGTSILARALSALISSVGLGVLNTLLGAAFSVLKFALILSVLYVALSHLNKEVNLIDAKYFKQSKTFEPISSLSSKALELFNTFTEEIKP